MKEQQATQDQPAFLVRLEFHYIRLDGPGVSSRRPAAAEGFGWREPRGVSEPPDEAESPECGKNGALRRMEPAPPAHRSSWSRSTLPLGHQKGASPASGILPCLLTAFSLVPLAAEGFPHVLHRRVGHAAARRDLGNGQGGCQLLNKGTLFQNPLSCLGLRPSQAQAEQVLDMAP